MSTDRYVSPLSERYASKEMQYIFSPDMKFRTWRRLWIALAETEKELGLNITQEQIDELKAHAEDINYDVAKERERQVRHDVMSHVYAYGVQCPKAKGIIHLGATSCYVGDNTDIIIMAEALKLVKKKLVNVLDELSKFADQYKDLPTLAFTHFQPAQPTTVGKRATLWTQEFIMDLEDLEYVMGSLKLLGSKGTTGTQASFLELFNGDQETIDKIDPMIAAKMGFKESYAVSGKTYSRKVDTRVANILAGIAASAHKMSNDIRLLQHLKEVEEPFEKSQIGSSAMAYKRNPMRSERIASLSRYVMIDALNPAITSATQWFERTLDDSANKRLSVPEGFLAIDGILDLYLNGVDGLAGDGLILGGDEDHQHHKAQHEIHDSTSYHDQCPLPNRCFIQGDAGGLHRRFRLRGGLLLHSMGSFCLLTFGAFLPFQRYKATHRQGAQTVLGAFMILFPEHRPHADGKLIDLNAAELCHSKMPELVDGDHRTEHEQRGKDGDNK